MADPKGGYIAFEDGIFPKYGISYVSVNEKGEVDIGIVTEAKVSLPYFVGLIGLNNGDGTGSMDYWYSNFVDEVLFEEYLIDLIEEALGETDI